jgi:hypothetical protein
MITVISAYGSYYTSETLMGASGLLAVVCNGFTMSWVGEWGRGAGEGKGGNMFEDRQVRKRKAGGQEEGLRRVTDRKGREACVDAWRGLGARRSRVPTAGRADDAQEGVCVGGRGGNEGEEGLQQQGGRVQRHPCSWVRGSGGPRRRYTPHPFPCALAAASW